MNPDCLTDAIIEAERFLAFAAKLQDAAEARGDRIYAGSKESAAVRRASLDLSRALSDLRNLKPSPTTNETPNFP